MTTAVIRAAATLVVIPVAVAVVAVAVTDHSLLPDEVKQRLAVLHAHRRLSVATGQLIHDVELTSLEQQYLHSLADKGIVTAEGVGEMGVTDYFFHPTGFSIDALDENTQLVEEVEENGATPEELTERGLSEEEYGGIKSIMTGEWDSEPFGLL